ncbi:hypothetical protein B9465_022885, partial [Klebsiella pneumoniae]
SAQIREILISESAWEEMTCLFAPSLINRRKLNFPCKTNGDYQACLCRSVRVKGLSSGPTAVAICPSRD